MIGLDICPIYGTLNYRVGANEIKSTSSSNAWSAF